MSFHATPVGLGAAAGDRQSRVAPGKFFAGVSLEEQVLVHRPCMHFNEMRLFPGFRLTRSQLDAQDFRRTYV
jgi:hypothetical protein